MFVGIDPSQRHTGICVLDSSLAVVELAEIAPTKPILESALEIRDQMTAICKRYPNATYGMEKMMPQATNGALLFYIQMVVLEVLAQETSRHLVHPLPVQLKSYMKRLLGSVPENKTAVVQGFKKLTSFRGRVSSNCADAYFAARMAEEVKSRRYSYRLSESELPLMTWGVMNGQ